jgi:hypothetical protein
MLRVVNGVMTTGVMAAAAVYADDVAEVIIIRAAGAKAPASHSSLSNSNSCLRLHRSYEYGPGIPP